MSATPDSTFTNPEQRIADLDRQLAEREAELAEALQRETATAEVLQVINSSPGDLGPVFDAMLDKALHLCGAAFGFLARFDGQRFHALASRGLKGDARGFFDDARLWTPDHGSAMQQMIEGTTILHIPDLVDTDAYRSGVASRLKFVELTGARSALWVALRNDGTLIGALVLYRREVRPFTDKQIALLQNFAAQAVIAMENARLITETREALEQQTATAEVLGVINSSPGELAPVFDAILEKAHGLCGAELGGLAIFDGVQFCFVAAHGVPDFAEISIRPRPDGNAPLERLTRGERFVHLADLRADNAHREFPGKGALADRLGVRTTLTVPLRKDGTLLGAVCAFRQEVRPFNDKQIAFLENFAAQAVIAMENARLLTETREALEQQTATAQVLQVINSPPGDLAPVFDAILEKAHALCGAAHGALMILDGACFRAIATRGHSEAFADVLRRGSPIISGSLLEQLAHGEPFVHIFDLAARAVERGARPSYSRGG